MYKKQLTKKNLREEKEIMRLNCIYEIYLFDNFKIPIIVDTAIIPIDFDIFFVMLHQKIIS